MEIEKNIGSKIKEIRGIKKVSLEDLSSRSNLDIDQIQKIEDGNFIPSLAPLIKIARALGVRLGTFLDDNNELGPVIVRSGQEKDGVRFVSKEETSGENLNFYSLAADKAGRHMEPFIVDIDPLKSESHKLSTHEGEEFIFVLEGQIEVNYGKETYSLSKGDSIYLDSIVSHNVHAANNEPARILACLYAPF